MASRAGQSSRAMGPDSAAPTFNRLRGDMHATTAIGPLAIGPLSRPVASRDMGKPVAESPRPMILAVFGPIKR